MEKNAVSGQKMSLRFMSVIMMRSGEERYMMTISCLKCCFWNRFRLVCHGLPF